MKLTVSITRFSDVGRVECALELELAEPRGGPPNSPAGKADRVRAREQIRRAYRLAAWAVDDQFARMTGREPGCDDDRGSPAPATPKSAAKDRGGGWYQPSAAPGKRPPGTDRPAPSTGRGLFRWASDEGRRLDVELIRHLTGWARTREFPARMIDWDRAQVAEAHAEAVRKLAEVAEAAGSAPAD